MKNKPSLKYIVKTGDSLTQLAKAAYGDESYYTQIAEYNNLDKYRDLIPGTEIYFPPLV
jgi:nucleoid-associated protein YgaU